jgi:hypothetical protein
MKRSLVVALLLLGALAPAPASSAVTAQSLRLVEAPSLLTEARSSNRPRTQSVRSYTRRDGRRVAAHRRAPRR